MEVPCPRTLNLAIATLNDFFTIFFSAPLHLSTLIYHM